RSRTRHAPPSAWRSCRAVPVSKWTACWSWTELRSRCARYAPVPRWRRRWAVIRRRTSCPASGRAAPRCGRDWASNASATYGSTCRCATRTAPASIRSRRWSRAPRRRCWGACWRSSAASAFGRSCAWPSTTTVARRCCCASPIYNRRLSSWVAAALRLLPDDAELELIPPPLLRRLKLPGLADALRYVHAPPPTVRIEQIEAGSHPSQRRLIVEELLAHHLTLKRRRLRQREHRAPPLAGDGRIAQRLRDALPFALTGAQQRVVAEVSADLAQRAPMLRLVQGDVGSGKTVVAALAAAQAIEAGHQVAVMAPTELLAEQHRRNFAQWFAPLDIEPVWLASKVKGRARTQALAAIADGTPLVIGTHALMQEGVAFARLGLAIVDEQHRFGVHQRLALREKGAGLVPHQLVMTATPIPRTLAMAAYADLDVSVIDELPPGRRPVTTVAVPAARREEVVARIHAACADG